MAKTIEEIKDQVAHEKCFSSWEQMYNIDTDSCIDSIELIAKLYANSKLEEAAEKCEYLVLVECEIIDKQSILNLREEF